MCIRDRLDGVAKEIIQPGAGVIAIYSGFEDEKIDSVSYIPVSYTHLTLPTSDLV